MTKQFITESELAARVSSLKEKMANEAWYNPMTWGQSGGAQTGGGAAVGNPKIAAQGKKAGATQAGTAAASTTPVAKPAAQPDPNVKALQDKLIAAGAKIKADGIMGPATRAAQQQFPQVTTQSPEEQAVAADLLSANDGSTTSGAAPEPRDPNAGLAGAAAGAAAPAAEPAAGGAATTTPAAAPAAAPAQGTAAGYAPAAAPAQGGLVDGSGKPVVSGSGQQVKTGATMESTEYGELQRIMSIVQYR